MRIDSRISSLAVLIVSALACGRAIAADASRTPDEERATFHLADDQLTVELMAQEPDVESPVAITWDEDGRLYVAEMRDYPLGPTSGRIRRLEDADGDGRYEHVTVFAEGLQFPNGLLWVRGGLLVTAAPDLFFFRDKDGDGRADEKKVLFTGFGEGNQQLRANGLVYGLDNWIYGANGRSDGAVRAADAATESAVSLRTRDFRFLPDGSRFEATSGQSQFGQTRDDWGNRFLSWNTIAVRHALLDAAAIDRQPRVAVAAVRDIAEPSDRSQVFPRSPGPTTFNKESTEHYNALGGLSIFRGDALGPDYRNQAFMGETLRNLVHRRQLEPQGSTFVSRRIDPGLEFLAAEDAWFHPVYFTSGPDGALWIVDFYRRWVEHPQFVPEQWRGAVEWQEGAAHGRIWRVHRRDAKLPPLPKLSQATSEELVALLGNTNGWKRDTAQRLLVERQDNSVAPALRDIVRGQAPLAAVHALWTLAGLGELDADTHRSALAHADAAVRIQALRALAAEPDPAAPLRDAALALATDSDCRVRFALACAVANWPAAEKLQALTTIWQRADDEDQTVLAVWSSLGADAGAFLERTIADGKLLAAQKPSQIELLRSIASDVSRAGDPAMLSRLAERASVTTPDQVTPAHMALTLGLAEGGSAKERGSSSGPTAAIAAARQWITDPARTAPDRTLAVDLVSALRVTDASADVMNLLVPEIPLELSNAAAIALTQIANPQIAQTLFAGWARYTPGVRRVVLQSALRSEMTTAALLDAISSGTVSTHEIDGTLREALGRLPNTELRQRAADVLAASLPAPRGDVIDAYSPSLKLAGNPARGAKLAKEHCLNCHRVLGVGARVGPDLSGMGARSKDALLVDLLDPSRQVSPDALQYTVVTHNGQVISGLIAADSPEGVALRTQADREEMIPRSDIAELAATGKSFMPEGLEQKLSPQDVADVLEFLTRPAAELLQSN